MIASVTGCRQILGIDDPTHDTTSGVDGGDGCFGAEFADGGLIKLCQQPTISNLVIATPIDTDSEPLCAIVSPPLGPPVCAIEAVDIHVTGSIAVTGSHPLVLVASHVIEVASGAVLDVSSKLGGRHGAGANDSGCPSSNVVGSTSLGGNGGTFGTSGGLGGGSTAMRGTPASIQFVRGGCGGVSPLPGGSSGPSGGAVYLIAGSELAIAGDIIAGGGGGAAGTGAGGGAGGGTGGLVGLDAPTISGSGAVFATGGGGGEGGGGIGTGGDGEDARDKFGQIAKGGNTVPNGGNGGNGAGYGNEAGDGGSGLGTGADMGGGGGGGGGAGIIWVRGTLGLTRVSPAPSP